MNSRVEGIAELGEYTGFKDLSTNSLLGRRDTRRPGHKGQAIRYFVTRQHPITSASIPELKKVRLFSANTCEIQTRPNRALRKARVMLHSADPLFRHRKKELAIAGDAS